MGALTYYSPAIIGFLLPFGLQGAVFSHPSVTALATWAQWSVLVLLAVQAAVGF